MKSIPSLALVACLVLSCSAVAVATTYTPATIADANALNPQPGDSVLFNRGNTYTGTLIAKGGSASAPVTYGMTGDSGDRPIIDAGGAQFGVLNIDNSYIVFDHLWVQNATKACFADVQMTSNANGGVYAENITFTNDAAYNCGDTANPGLGGGAPYYGEAGIYVVGYAGPGQHGLAGIVIANNDCGHMNVTTDPDDGRACILVRSAHNPQITYNYVHSDTAMGIAVRQFFGNYTAGDGGYIANNSLTSNEGNIVSYSNNTFIGYNVVNNSRGFGAQAYPGSTITGNTFTHLSISASGALINGIDENGYPNVTITNNSFSDVYGCMVTLEVNMAGTDSHGASISGNDFDSRTGGSHTGCIFYVQQQSLSGLSLGENHYYMYDTFNPTPFQWPTNPNDPSAGDTYINARTFLNVYPSPMDGSELFSSGCTQQISNGQFVQPLCQ